MKSLQTFYNGYHFRSRLEARWAVFFDALCVKFRYEHEDFILKSGVRYLPDFYFPDPNFKCFGEVKPFFTQNDIDKCIDFVCSTGNSIILLDDAPDFKCLKLLYALDHSSRIDKDRIIKSSKGHDVGFTVVLFCADQASSENRFFYEPGYEEYDLTIRDKNFSCLGDFFIEAVHKSRAARFENFKQ